MYIMKNNFVFLSLLTVFALTVSGCSNAVEEYLSPSGSDGDLDDFVNINMFIAEATAQVYLWESETDWSKYNSRNALAEYTDHYKLFDEFIYKDDHWSELTDNISELMSQFEGVSTTFGYRLRFYKLASTGSIVAVVLYTYPGSPAEYAGLKRGDIIVEMNGGEITEDDYVDLYNAAYLAVRCGVWDAESRTVEPLPEVKNITAVNMYENPVNTYKVIEKDGHKIGYLCYTGYQVESEKDLERIFTDFKSEGVTDVVLDLRYNSGGHSRTARFLSSILAPESVVRSKSVFLEHHYNHRYTNYYNSIGEDLNERFFDTLSINMNLDRLYVLTSNNTASASEATIVGLDPYFNVVRIGSTTSGKYCGGILLSPQELYGESSRDYYSGFSNWGMYIMIYRFANIDGLDSFAGGLMPDIFAEEDSFDLKPLGDEDDPLLGRALAHIFGQNYVDRRSGKVSLPVVKMPDIKRPVYGLMISTLPSALPIFSDSPQVSE